LRDTGALEARTQGLDVLVVMGNLPIPRPAVGSADAAKHDEQGFPGVRGGLRSPLERVVPAQELFLSRGSTGHRSDRAGGQAEKSKPLLDW